MTSTIPTISELDAARIREMAVHSHGYGGVAVVGALLDWVSSEADVVPAKQITPDVVTLGSTVSYKEIDSHEVHRVAVVHPADSSIPERRISVLSPVGRALLGRRVGEYSEVSMPAGRQRLIQVLELHYQPEAAGVAVP